MCACVHVSVQVTVQLCIFHVLKVIWREIMKLIPNDKQQKVYSIIHSLVHTRHTFRNCPGMKLLTLTSEQTGCQYDLSGKCQTDVLLSRLAIPRIIV